MSKFEIGQKVLVKAVSAHVRRSHVGQVGEVCGISAVTNESGLPGWLDIRLPDNEEISLFQREGAYETIELITTKGDNMEQPKQRRTFKLLKDTPEVPKGNLYQQAYEGSETYKVINTDWTNIDHYDMPEEVVLDPKWFVEVFAVEPQFMTREELDQWEAFKSRKKPGRKAAVKAETATELVNRVQKNKSKWTPARRKAQSANMQAHWAAKKAQKAA